MSSRRTRADLHLLEKVMRHESLRDLKAIYRHFQAHRDAFPHVRQDALKRRIEAHQCVYQDGVVITYQQYRKRSRVGNVQVPARRDHAASNPQLRAVQRRGQ